MKAPDGWEFVPGQGEEAFTRPHGLILIRRLSFLTRISAWFAPESTPETRAVFAEQRSTVRDQIF